MKNKPLTIIALLPFLLGCAQRNYEIKDYRKTMTFHEDFKILQLTDLHYGIESDLAKQFSFLEANIMEANPDLIVLTGDNFMYGTKDIVYNTINHINRCCQKLTKENNKLTKFAMTFGNHDNQGDYPRYYINKVLASFSTTEGKEIEENKYCSYVDYEDDKLFGLTNYFIDLVDENDATDVKYRIHIIDSNTYKFLGFKYGYDVIHTEQLEHAKNIYEYSTPDKDYIGLAFFHIPLLNFKEAINQYNNASNKEDVGRGSFYDKDHYPYKDNGSYEGLKSANISMYFVGHDHRNFGDIIYTDKDGDKALFSYGVKSSNQLYNDKDKIGYKTITLKDNITKEQILNMDYINNYIINVTNKGGNYEQ